MMRFSEPPLKPPLMLREMSMWVMPEGSLNWWEDSRRVTMWTNWKTRQALDWLLLWLSRKGEMHLSFPPWEALQSQELLEAAAELGGDDPLPGHVLQGLLWWC
jgi:hypothetical protein